MRDDPWSSMQAARSPRSINARRVDETGRWDFYWGCDSECRCLLVLRHSSDSAPKEKLPLLKGVEVFCTTTDDDKRPGLVFRLLDPALRDIFLILCRDIVAGAARSRSEREAVAAAVARTWRWHHLLRGGGARLSEAEQKGLIGELLLLEHHALGSLPPAAAVEGWRGPLGAAKDFAFGRMSLEAKARGSDGAFEVLIHSEQQLDDTGIDELYLHISVLDAAPEDDSEAFSLSDVAVRVRDRVAAIDSRAADRLGTLLAAAGFRYEDDYSLIRWRGGERTAYRVGTGFPRLTPHGLPDGVMRVRYSIALTSCESFLVSLQELDDAIRRNTHAA